MATGGSGTLDQNIPQWKRELILRRRAVGRVLSTGSGSVQLTCPSVVAAVRFPECSVDSDFLLRRCESEREPTGCYKNMRLAEQVNASDDFVEPCVILDIKEIITKIESGSGKYSKMGEEKNGKKINNNTPLNSEKKSKDLICGDDDDNASDSSEEFKYGPGIVSKLKSKYLSLTLRESQGRVRPPLDSLRRATSLENILDDAPENEKSGDHKSKYLKNIKATVNGNSSQRCRGLSRTTNKDSMKRARSVEVLTRYDRGNVISSRRSFDGLLKEEGNDVDSRKKIRNRINSSSVEETELPPPDLVKHTLKIFEASQNPKNALNIKKKNNLINHKSGSDSVCAKKPLICLKPSLVAKQNGLDNSVKTPTEIVNSSVNEITNKNKFSDKSKINKIENSSEATLSNKPGLEISSTVERRKAALLKNKTSETVIKSKSSNDIESIAADTIQDENNCEKGIIPTSQLKESLSLDLTDFSKGRASPLTMTSPKLNPDRGLSDSGFGSPEPKRCISPVLVRAPPCILSSELNSSNSPPQPMKQVGVIRPIVTNKTVHSNLTKHPVNKLHLTEREIEKNLINKVKSIEQPVTKVIVSLKKSPEECFANNIGDEGGKKNGEAIKKGQFWDKKPNTMVFNFSNRKTVPDYIENDGLILAPRKEKPKLGEPGIIFLGGGTEDSSSDFDLEELSTEPPLPCDIVFEGDNVLINGKSNIQSKPKLRKMKIQFNDEATTLFEYPSEASLLDDTESPKSEPEVDSSVTSSPGLPNPFRCSNLASYTPSKVSLSTDFELGVTKTNPPPCPKEKDGNDGTEKREDKEEEEVNDGDDGYLRPADENTTVPWSAETAADLLF